MSACTQALFKNQEGASELATAASRVSRRRALASLAASCFFILRAALVWALVWGSMHAWGRMRARVMHMHACLPDHCYQITRVLSL
jgi:hypothetical protein